MLRVKHELQQPHSVALRSVYTTRYYEAVSRFVCVGNYPRWWLTCLVNPIADHTVVLNSGKSTIPQVVEL